MKVFSHFTRHPFVAAVAISLALSSSVCSQSAQPLTPDNPTARQLNLLVLGDSIMWGQGLIEQHKAWYQVKSWLKESTSREVRENVAAHSGAVVGVNDAPPWNYARPDGEVSSAVPV